MLQTCIFPAAGYGTRFLPATKTLPKEMLPILTKPLIHYGVDEALEAGMENMGFVTGRGKRALEDYLIFLMNLSITRYKKEYLLDEIRSLINRCTFTFTRQNQMKGLGDAVLKGKPLVGDEAFGVILADDLCVNEEGLNVMAQMVKIYEKYRCTIIAVMEVPKEQVSNYGVIFEILEENLIMVNSMIEKPSPDEAPSNLAIIGRYILTPDIFGILENTKAGKNGEIQLTDALLTQATNGMVLAIPRKRFDCGSVEGFVEATNYFYEKSKC